MTRSTYIHIFFNFPSSLPHPTLSIGWPRCVVLRINFRVMVIGAELNYVITLYTSTIPSLNKLYNTIDLFRQILVLFQCFLVHFRVLASKNRLNLKNEFQYFVNIFLRNFLKTSLISLIRIYVIETNVKRLQSLGFKLFIYIYICMYQKY